MNAVHEDVKKLVDKELAAATERFGLHHSWHEKYAVVGEEVEESCEEMEALVDSVKLAWKQTRGNETDYIKEQTYDGVYDAAVRLAIEAIQVAAMAKKEIYETADNGTAEISDHGAYTGKDDVRVLHCDVCRNDFVSTIRLHPHFCPECGAEFTNVLRF